MTVRHASAFSQAFSRHLGDILSESPATITQQMIAERLPGSRVQSYVSERLGGRKPVDTDMIDAIADLLNWSPAWLVGQILGRMGREGEEWTR